MCHMCIHSSIGGHPGCFHVLATVHSAAVSTGRVYLVFVFPSVKYAEVELRDHGTILLVRF